MYHGPLVLQHIYGGKNGDGKEGSEIPGEGRAWRLPGLFYADDLAMCGDSEEDLRVMVGCIVEVCRRRGLKVNGAEWRERIGM